VGFAAFAEFGSQDLGGSMHQRHHGVANFTELGFSAASAPSPSAVPPERRRAAARDIRATAAQAETR